MLAELVAEEFVSLRSKRIGIWQQDSGIRGGCVEAQTGVLWLLVVHLDLETQLGLLLPQPPGSHAGHLQQRFDPSTHPVGVLWNHNQGRLLPAQLHVKNGASMGWLQHPITPMERGPAAMDGAHGGLSVVKSGILEGYCARA